MVLEQEIPPFLDWFLMALVISLPIILASVAAFGCLIGFLVSASRRGPVEGFYAVAKVIASGVSDLVNFSLRRTWAMAMLAFRESMRRRVLIAFAVFVVIMLLAGWYLDVKSEHPARLYLSFVLTTSNYLVILLALFLSTFSLPSDFKNRTIQTIVTKPVRPLEIILGRVVGFVAVGTLILAAMCLISYFFVVRGLRHEHGVEVLPVAEQTSDDASTDPGVTSGDTTFEAHHRHTFEVRADGLGETDVVMGHSHLVDRVGEGPEAALQIGPALGMLQARVPRRGTLRFLDRSGQPGTGLNVGNEWMYRSYIEGGTLAACVWTFDGITAERYPDGLDLELNLSVFRTHKGNIERGIRGSIFIRNPDPSGKMVSSEEFPFVAKEYVVDKQFIPRKLKAKDRQEVLHDVDLFEDLATDGKIEIRIQCSDSGQYFGMAPADLYILESEASFGWNFIKGYIGVWLQMVLVTTFGVMFSTFLSGAVAMLATLSSIVVGYFSEFIMGVATGSVMGGGPIESIIRIVTQANVQSPLELPDIAVRIVKGFDIAFMHFMQVAAQVMPNYESFNTAGWVAYGYNVEPGLLTMHVLRTLTYFVLVSVVGYFFLKTREVAA